MMKTMKMLFWLLLGALPVQAQEYYTNVVKIGQADEYLTTRPIDVTEEVSEVELRSSLADYYQCFEGDLITQMSFTGYNPGGEVKRHVTVIYEHRGDHVVLFDDDVIIPSGGTADAPITLLSFEPLQPLKANIMMDFRVKSWGEVADTPICFEGHDWTPAITVTKQTEVVYYDGTVSAMNGTPIAGADVCLYWTLEGQRLFEYHGLTDAQGRYSVRVEESNSLFQMSVDAEGYPVYQENRSFGAKEGGRLSFFHPSKDISLSSRLDFTVGQQATIFLPETPDASWGRYYRFDRYEGRDLIFEREDEPQANVPYVIFPNRDFSIDVSGYDLAALAEADYLPFSSSPSDGNEWNFHGSFCNKDFIISFGIRIFDSTPDCWDGKIPYPPRVGAFRAYIYATSEAVAQYGDEARCVFVGEETGINDASFQNGHSKTLYDLQGRPLKGVPLQGMYIRDGKKFVVR